LEEVASSATSAIAASEAGIPTLRARKHLRAIISQQTINQRQGRLQTSAALKNN